MQLCFTTNDVASNQTWRYWWMDQRKVSRHIVDKHRDADIDDPVVVPLE